MSDWRTSSLSGGGGCVEVRWRTSSFTNGGGACVEVGFGADELNTLIGLVRDSKNRDGGTLTLDVPALARWARRRR